jgi:hypothetical protein
MNGLYSHKSFQIYMIDSLDASHMDHLQEDRLTKLNNPFNLSIVNLLTLEVFNG